MKINLDKEKFEKAIYKADKITGKNTTMPVLKCVLVISKGKKVKIRSTNLDLGIEIEIPGNISDEGAIAVPGDVLSGFLSSVRGGGEISLETKGNSLSVTTKGNKATINTFPFDDFPVLSSVSGGQTAEIEAGNFVKGLRSVWYAASPSSIKPELSSVFMHYDDNMIVFAATDSFRLAEKRIPAKDIQGFDSVLVPLKNIGEIVRNLEEGEGVVEIKVDKSQAAIFVENVYLTSRTIEGVFPDYKQIIPKSHSTEVVVLRQDIVDALKVSNVFSDKFNQINLKINPNKNEFKIDTKNTDVGESTTTVPAKTIGEPIEIGFNYKYVMDCFQSVQSDNVSLTFNGKGKPMVIRGVGDKSFMYLAMPMSK